jgi:hypothetical protein
MAVAATGKFSQATRSALIISLFAFALIAAAMAFWAGRLDRLQRQHRKAMDALVGADIDELVKQRENSSWPVTREDVRIVRDPMGRRKIVLFGYGFFPPTLLTLALAAIVLAALLISGTI